MQALMSYRRLKFFFLNQRIVYILSQSEIIFLIEKKIPASLKKNFHSVEAIFHLVKISGEVLSAIFCLQTKVQNAHGLE